MDGVKDHRNMAFPARPYSRWAGREFPTFPLWGDTHLRTGLSMDAGAFGARLTPADAYRFAKGEKLVSSTGHLGVYSRLVAPTDYVCDQFSGSELSPGDSPMMSPSLLMPSPSTMRLAYAK